MLLSQSFTLFCFSCMFLILLNVFSFFISLLFFYLICLYPLFIVCVIIPLTPSSNMAPFISRSPSSIFATPTPTPPPTPLTPTSTNGCTSSSRRSPSYESSLSFKDLAPLAQFDVPQSHLRSSASPSFNLHCLSPDPRQFPAFPFSARGSSPIPLITSPLPSSANHCSPSPFSPTFFPTSPTSVPASPPFTMATPTFPHAEPVTLSPTMSGSFSGFSCHTTTPTKATTVSTSHTKNYPTIPFSQIPCSASTSKDSLVAQLAPSSSSSRPVSPLSIILPLSPSGSRCSSPSPLSPPLRSLSPCPVCRVPAVSPPPSRAHTDPSKVELFI